MTSEECIAHIQTSGLFNDAEIKQWTVRIQHEGMTETCITELLSDLQRRTGMLLDVMGITDERTDAAKDIFEDFHNQLKEIAKEYRAEEKQIEKEGGDMLRKEDQLEAVKHIAESKAVIANITEKKEKSS